MNDNVRSFIFDFRTFVLSIVVILLIIAVNIGFNNIITKETLLGKWSFVSNNLENSQKENVFFGNKSFKNIEIEFLDNDKLKISDVNDIYDFKTKDSIITILNKNAKVEEYRIFTRFVNNYNQECFTLKKLKSIYVEQTNGIICKN